MRERQHIWPRALLALENVAVEGVTLKSVDFTAGSESFAVTLEVPDNAKLLQYLAALNEGQGHERNSLLWSVEQAGLGSNASGIEARLAARPWSPPRFVGAPTAKNADRR